MCLLKCWRKVYSRPGVGLVLGQRRRRLTSIEPAMSCDAGPTLNWNWVGRSTSYVRAKRVFSMYPLWYEYIVETRGSTIHWQLIMDVGQHRWSWWKEYTLKIYILTGLPGSFLYLRHLGFWHMRKRYTIQNIILSIALKQTKTGLGVREPVADEGLLEIGHHDLRVLKTMKPSSRRTFLCGILAKKRSINLYKNYHA